MPVYFVFDVLSMILEALMATPPEATVMVEPPTLIWTLAVPVSWMMGAWQ